ncbi:expressed protein [Phakopsora pachyrhizi]|uniref:Conserved oligomeric Golgi complex subunit 1 n=1 Tax=Phakopsora pachyrhizi TaxID=170000 RepID=A0AAV0B850_PHAPC|nr:expressed protein [Phakopsora pachyrhizi]
MSVRSDPTTTPDKSRRLINYPVGSTSGRFINPSQPPSDQQHQHQLTLVPSNDLIYNSGQSKSRTNDNDQSYHSSHNQLIRSTVNHQRPFPIGVRPESIDLLAISEPDDLFQSFTIREIRILEQRARSDGEKKSKELRSMVGERYRDLLSVADSIVRMKDRSDELHKELSMARDECDVEELERRVSDLEVNRSNSSKKPSSKTSYTLATLVKLIIDLSEHIWRSLERHDFLTAARFEDLGRIISTELSSGRWDETGMTQAGQVSTRFPIVDRQSETISQLGPQISSGAKSFLRKWEITHHDTQASLAALVILDNATISESLRSLLAARRSALGSLIVSSRSHHFSWIDRIKASIRLIFSTLSHIQNIFESGQFFKLLRALQKNPSDSLTKPEKDEDEKKDDNDDIRLPSIISLLPNAHQSMKYIPTSIINYSPFINPLNRSEAIDFRSESNHWFEECQRDLMRHIEAQLEFINSSDGLIDFRDDIDRLMDQMELSSDDLITVKHLQLWERIRDSLRVKFDLIYSRRLNSLKQEIFEKIETRELIEFKSKRFNWIFDESLPDLMENERTQRAFERTVNFKRRSRTTDEKTRDDDDEEEDKDDLSVSFEESEAEESFIKRYNRSIRNRIQGKRTHNIRDHKSNVEQNLEHFEEDQNQTKRREKGQELDANDDEGLIGSVVNSLEEVSKSLRTDFEKFYTHKTKGEVFLDGTGEKKSVGMTKRVHDLEGFRKDYFEFGCRFVDDLLKGLNRILDQQIFKSNLKKVLFIGELAIQICSTRFTFMRNLSLLSLSSNQHRHPVYIQRNKDKNVAEKERSETKRQQNDHGLIERLEGGLNLIIFKSFKSYLTMDSTDRQNPIQLIFKDFLKDFYYYSRVNSLQRSSRALKNIEDEDEHNKNKRTKTLLTENIRKKRLIKQPSLHLITLIESINRSLLTIEQKTSSSQEKAVEEEEWSSIGSLLSSHVLKFKFFKTIRRFLILRVLQLIVLMEFQSTNYHCNNDKKNGNKGLKVEIKEEVEGAVVERRVELNEEIQEEEFEKREFLRKNFLFFRTRDEVDDRSSKMDTDDDDCKDQEENDQSHLDQLVFDLLCLKTVLMDPIDFDDYDLKYSKVDDDSGGDNRSEESDRSKDREIFDRVNDRLDRLLDQEELSKRVEKVKGRLESFLVRVERNWYLIMSHQVDDQTKKHVMNKDNQIKGLRVKTDQRQQQNEDDDKMYSRIELVKPGIRFGLISIY